jgi:inhibitor of cysteine peptidase
MSHKSLYIAALGIVFVMMTGCGSRQTKFTAVDNGKTVGLKTGDQVVIMLDANPSTGYTWEVKDLDASMIQQVGESGFKSSNPGLIGSGGLLTLTFKTLKAGTTTLTLVYHRPWETDVKPQDTFTLPMVVK